MCAFVPSRFLVYNGLVGVNVAAFFVLAWRVEASSLKTPRV